MGEIRVIASTAALPALSAAEEQALAMLEMLIKHGDTLPAAASKLSVMTAEPQLVQNVLLYREALAKHIQKMILKGPVTDPGNVPDPWYTGPGQFDKFWPGLKSQLEADPSWAHTVPSLDETSTQVVGLLADPHSPVIDTRGLVVGYVQSGKTANFTATIAKAADAGYRLFIVLSGVHNSLRRQTQLRLDNQLCTQFPADWLQLTDQERDFGNPVKALPLVAGTQLKLLAVVKKNVSRLTRLRDWLLQAHEHGGLNTCPVLIIDDESDQASVNTSNPELDRTKINQLIVELLGLPRVAYVGYTATPFANVLVNPKEHADLYPRTFIYALPKPNGYFGAEELFGSNASGEASEPHDMVRYVAPDEADLHRVTTKEPFVPTVTSSLGDAIRWFVLATSARRVRTGQIKHSSMLIHTTMRVDPQLQYLPIIREYLKKLAAEWLSGTRSQWANQWDEERALEPADRFGHESLTFADIEPEIGAVLADVVVVADNSSSPERLIYSDDPATVVAVGGNTLSRGLTLEGLVSSFFLRQAGAYDSVLQMGRWFGYRPGYEDLPRIWTTQDLAVDYQFLSGIETDIRREIDKYSGGSTSPSQLAVRIQLHPRMQVTSAAKMRFAVPALSSFSEQRPQTTHFYDDESATINLTQTRLFLKKVLDQGLQPQKRGSDVLLNDVSVESVLEFLAGYQFHERSEMSKGLLNKYIKKQIEHGGLKKWNVGVVSVSKSQHKIDIGLGFDTNLITRSRSKNQSANGTLAIGVLTSPSDKAIDLDEISGDGETFDAVAQKQRNDIGRPLLLLYPIDMDSKAPANSKSRLNLGAKQHLIGVAIVFPVAVEGSDPKNSIQVDLPIPLEEDIDETKYQDIEGDQNDVLGDV